MQLRQQLAVLREEVLGRVRFHPLLEQRQVDGVVAHVAKGNLVGAPAAL